MCVCTHPAMDGAVTDYCSPNQFLDGRVYNVGPVDHTCLRRACMLRSCSPVHVFTVQLELGAHF